MGGHGMTETGLGQALFSRVQLRVLGLLFGQPDRSFRSSELIILAKSGTGAVHRELEKLTGASIVSITMFANRKLYRANRQSPIYDELHGIILKTVGLLEPIREALKRFRTKIEVAFVYGSIARGNDTAQSDVDLMIIGENLAYSDVYTALQNAEKGLLRTVNPTLMNSDDWRQKVADQSSFIRKVLTDPKLFVFGSENDLEGIGKSSQG
jgi:predicted nucleotidyltransferase